MDGIANNNQFKVSKGLLTLNLTSPSGFITLNNEVPQQNLKLVQYRAEMATDAAAVAQKVIYFECNVFNNANIVSDRLNHFAVPIYLEYIDTTVAYTSMIVGMSQPAQRTMSYSLRSFNGALITDFVSLNMTFEFDLIST